MKLPRADDILLRDCCETRACQKAWAAGAPTPTPHTIEKNPESPTDGVICSYRCDGCGREWTCRFGGYFVTHKLHRLLTAAGGILRIGDSEEEQEEQLAIVR